MTTHRDLKRIIRERQRKTGESYTGARLHGRRERAALLGLAGQEPMASEPIRLDAAVLKINRQSARVRIASESGQTTFRSQDVWASKMNREYLCCARSRKPTGRY